MSEGENYLKSFYADCKSRAEEKYEAYMREHSAGQSEITFRCLGEAMDDYLENVLLKSELANSTKTKYEGAYRNLLQGTHLAGRPLREVTAMDLQRFTITWRYVTAPNGRFITL